GYSVVVAPWPSYYDCNHLLAVNDFYCSRSSGLGSPLTPWTFYGRLLRQVVVPCSPSAQVGRANGNGLYLGYAVTNRIFQKIWADYHFVSYSHGVRAKERFASAECFVT
ncbi:MAG TPA: hypothetical protein VMZ27_15785, partial [Candidatus Saccharimonadales bacterium]|nr:hypothetical protein [Candidatus Saccharimonadales bacterium]